MLFASQADALLIPPVAAEYALPLASFNVIRIPGHVSAYSIENVSFDMLGTGTLFQPQHLEVYAWDPDNLTPAGIRWVRRDAAWNIVDAGYITTPDIKMSYQVGILQDDVGNTFVIAAWKGNYLTNNGVFYETYLWTPTGLVASTLPTEIIVGSLPLPTNTGVRRVSMDCYRLKKAVVVFDDIHISSLGHINACVFNMGLGLTVSNTIYVAGAGGSCQSPDVSLGNNGNTVRIAYIDAPAFPITPPHDIYVSSVNFSTIASAPDGAMIPFAPDSYLPGATTELASLLHIDCPDNFGSDIWSLAYLQDPNRVIAHTKRPSSALVSTPVSVPGYTGYANPVVSYGQNGNIIVYGWYSSDQNTYIATQLSNNGTTFLPPTMPGTFYDIPLSTPFIPASTFYKDFLAFSTNSDNSRLSMGYLVTDGGSPSYYDLRSKNVNWLPAAMRSEGLIPPDDNVMISVAAVPNPFTHKISLSVQPYDGEPVNIRMVDITGKVLLDLQGQDLFSVNRSLDMFSHSLPPGNYFINVDIKDVHSILKIVKL
ncbi:MAG: T9SS type A sorting domain-containing protein [Taibaiella sp.]|nr:T9SS type A sorting domain-containing protein [Taibaiella sp.]